MSRNDIEKTAPTGTQELLSTNVKAKSLFRIEIQPLAFERELTEI